MGRCMQTRIFWPVLIVILFLSAGVWLAFSATSERYATYTAEKYTSEIIKMVEEGKSIVYETIPNPSTKEDEREYSKELLQYVKSRMKTGEFTGRLLVFNSRFKQTYPQITEEGTIPDSLRRACTDLLIKNNNVESLKETFDIDGSCWHIHVTALSTKQNVRAKYFIALAQMPNMSLMWNYMGNLLAGITAVAVCLAVVLIWLTAGSISRPLKKFCQLVQSAGTGKTFQIEETYSLSELETLKKTYNQLEAGIRQSQEAKERFFQNVSHDLRTPLSSIIGYAQGIQSGVMKDPQAAAEIIMTESIRMKNLVESILTLTKMDNQELHLHPVEIDLEEFLEERLDALKGMAWERQLRLETKVENLTICTDPELLSRIFQNVISNCIRYAKRQVLVRLEAENACAVIHVEDDGPGFMEEELPHVFERFYHDRSGGFGIGLSFVWSGMDYLGGKVEIGNRKPPQHGAFYRLHFPL